MSATALKDKMKSAGVDTATAALYTCAIGLLAKAKGNPAYAVREFLRALGHDDEMREALALDYLTRIASDMSSGGNASGGHISCETQMLGAADQSDAGSSHHKGETHPLPAASAPDLQEPERCRQMHVETHKRCAQRSGSPSTPISLAARKAAIQAAQVRVSIYEERLMDGQRIGHLQWHALEKFAAKATREGAWARLITRSRRNVDPFAKVMSVVSESELQRMKQKAAEIQDDS
jgi:hypothetical protein